MKWLLLISVPILLICALVVVDMTMLEPYLQYKAVINRRTGEYIEYEVHYNHFAKRYFADVQPMDWSDLTPYGTLTAPNVEVPICITVYQQHFWSPRMMDATRPRNAQGDRLTLISSLLFSQLNEAQNPSYNGSKPSHEKSLELYRQRIEIWNSSFPELATPEDIEKLRDEDDLLFPPLAH